MNPQYLRTEGVTRDRWMISYMDVLTILLIFFLAAAAKQLEHPVPLVAHPAQAQIAAPSPIAPTEPARAALLQAQARLREHGLDSQLEPRGLVISLSQVILFPPGADTVGPDALPLLSQIADVLRDLPNHDVRLIGHADVVPIHTRQFHSNWDLSMARSLKILELLIQRYGIPESRLSIASYGSYRPAAPNNTVGGRASNRRVEIVVLDDIPRPDAPEFASNAAASLTAAAVTAEVPAQNSVAANTRAEPGK